MQCIHAQPVRLTRAAAASGYMRVIDESGEDYVYPAHYFVALELPQKAKRAWTASRGPANRRSSSNSGLSEFTQRRGHTARDPGQRLAARDQGGTEFKKAASVTT